MNILHCENVQKYLGLDLEKEIFKIPVTAKLAVLRGSWRQMGCQYTHQASASIRYYIGEQTGMAFEAFSSPEEVYRVLPSYEKRLDKVFPEYLDFLRGIADGLTEQGYCISYEDILIAYLTIAPEPKACMAVSAWGKATRNGKSYAVIHSDSSHAGVYTQPAILAYPEKGHCFFSAVGFTNAYMNDAGLVCMATQGGAGSSAFGLPACIGGLYNAVYADNAEQALKNHETKLRSGSAEITHYIDEKGNAGIIESNDSHYGIRYSGENGEMDYLLQSNGFWTKEMIKHTGPDLPDNRPRYVSAREILKRSMRKLTLKELVDALSSTDWYDETNDTWISEWSEDEDISMFSPENKSPKYGCCMRRAFDIEGRDMYLLMGSADPLVSKLPGALGTYCRLKLQSRPEETAETALEEARLQVWKAARYLSENTDREKSAYMPYFDRAREAVFSAQNYINIARAVQMESEKLSLLGKAVSKAAEAQCYAKAAGEKQCPI